MFASYLLVTVAIFMMTIEIAYITLPASVQIFKLQSIVVLLDINLLFICLVYLCVILLFVAVHITIIVFRKKNQKMQFFVI